MERILSSEEKIRRAQEIYYKRRNENVQRNSVTRVNVTNTRKKTLSVSKKMILQMLICLVLYFIIYLIQNTNYFFSEEVMNKTKQILSQDLDFGYLYEQFLAIFRIQEEQTEPQAKEEQQEKKPDTQENQEKKEEEQVTPKQQIDEIPEQTASVPQQLEEVSSLDPMQEDAKIIKDTISLVKPITGTVTSEFGPRNEPEEIVSSYHTGIDIAAAEGTIIQAGMDGKVTISQSDPGYGNYIKIENGEIATLYAHCKVLYVKVGDEVKKGQEIAEVGMTGNATGNHVHFEVRRQDRLVNPRDVVEI